MSATEQEFQQIHREFEPRIRRYLASYVGDAEAPDLAQDVFVKVHRGLEQFRGEAQLSTWIYRIATNAALDQLRSAAFRERRAALSLDARDCAEPADRNAWTGEAAPTPDRDIGKAEMRACIRDYIHALPETYRAILVLRDLEGLSTTEAAAVLEISAGAAKIRLHRARARLQDALRAGCTFDRDERNTIVCEPKDALRAPTADEGGVSPGD